MIKKDLRQIIVAATSDMLDHPNAHGIYPTSKFYDRLEVELAEYIEGRATHAGISISSSDIHELMLQTVKNSLHVSIPMQNAIAKYIDYQSAPRTFATGSFKV